MNPPNHAITKNAVEIKIGDAPLAWKLDALSAALLAIRDAHRDTMPAPCWAAINHAVEKLGEAVLQSQRRNIYPPQQRKDLP